jgi:hypothetical protein
MMLALRGWGGRLGRRLASARPGAGGRRRIAAGSLLLGALAAACSQPQAYGPPAPSRVGYERLQQAYAVWQLLDRAREATAQLKSWRELDPETGSSWDYAIPNLSHYRFFAMDGRFHEGYESDETDCWLRDDGRWDRRPIGRRPPVAAALADDLFGGAVRIFAEDATEINGESVQVVRFSQRAGDRRWSTLAQDREVRVWLALEDALPRRVEVAAPSFAAPERTSARLLSHFDEPLDVDSPCS